MQERRMSRVREEEAVKAGKMLLGDRKTQEEPIKQQKRGYSHESHLNKKVCPPGYPINCFLVC